MGPASRGLASLILSTGFGLVVAVEVAVPPASLGEWRSSVAADGLVQAIPVVGFSHFLEEVGDSQLPTLNNVPT